MEEILKLAKELICQESVTPNDAGCLDIIGARLRKLDFELTKIRSGPVDNLWAVRGEGGNCLAFAGHTDVVPPGNLLDWRTPPFEPAVIGNRLYGRGAADMKGSLAAMVIAMERFILHHPGHPGRIGFLLTSDEEGPATDGTIKLMEYLERERVKVKWCVVGEPSSTSSLGDVIRVGRRGSLNGLLTVKGVQGHVAYPQKALNPIHVVLGALEQMTRMQWDCGNRYYPPTSFQISNIQSGTGAENVIPSTLEAKFNFRFSNEQTSAGLKRRVDKILNRDGLDYDLDWRLSGEPFLTSGGTLIDTVVNAVSLHTTLSPELSTGGGTSDGRFIAPQGVEVVELGPINETIHKVNEFVLVDDLETLCKIYNTIACELLLE